MDLVKKLKFRMGTDIIKTRLSATLFLPLTACTDVQSAERVAISGTLDGTDLILEGADYGSEDAPQKVAWIESGKLRQKTEKAYRDYTTTHSECVKYSH